MSQELIDLIQTESVGLVDETLNFFLDECSISEAPSRDEVAQWQSLLQARGGKFQRLAQRCQDWLAETDGAA